MKTLASIIPARHSEPASAPLPAAGCAALDREILALLQKRARLAQAAAADPGLDVTGLAEAAPRVARGDFFKNSGPLPSVSLAAIFREIDSACLNLARPVRVCFAGAEFGAGHQAAQLFFGASIAKSPAPSLKELFRRVESGRYGFAVACLEQRAAGSNGHLLDLLLSGSLKIAGEVLVPETVSLMGRGAGLPEVEEVGVPAWLPQACRARLAARLPQARLTSYSGPAPEPERYLERPEYCFAARPVAAPALGLAVLEHGLEIPPGGVSRHLVVSRRDAPRTGRDKTALAFVTGHRPGALQEALGSLAADNLNLTRIESRPLPERPFEYAFFVDVDGHRRDPDLSRALNRMAACVESLTVLGSFPKAH